MPLNPDGNPVDISSLDPQSFNDAAIKINAMTGGASYTLTKFDAIALAYAINEYIINNPQPQGS